ncbi:MAG TPA: hypothetical protein PLD55_06515 [bacterium]|jgi:hypothetical protein|nr:hypothetical protein [bacterium]MDX9805049.1 hypothetical protein [bacterium]HOB70602.1 hypothetical protein [bacterium]HOG42818.1 hypothetical protein [bacterium]HPG35943.1 hypothetical protein [bacterium]
MKYDITIDGSSVQTKSPVSDFALKYIEDVSRKETLKHFYILENEFETLKEKWKKEVKLTSSMTEIINNENYQKIIELGYDVIDFIYEELKKEPDFWFYALKEITGADPVRSSNYGNLKAMTQDWISWFKSNGF